MNPTPPANHYAVLGVLPSASLDEIRSSYRQLAKRYHPDMKTGNAHQFKRIQDAYDTLSDSHRREVFNREWQAHSMRMRAAAEMRVRAERQEKERGAAKPASSTAAKPPMAVLTRLMSIAVPRSGRFQLSGVIGNITVEPTTVETLWDTTLKKFGDQDAQRLTQHVIQIKLSGERDLVRSMMPRPTDFGVEFEQTQEQEKRSGLFSMLSGLFGNGAIGGLFSHKPFGLYGAYLPLSLSVTVPRGIALTLNDVTGSILLGDLENEINAKLLGGTLRAGSIRRARLTLNGSSQGYINRVSGPVDLMVFGESKVRLEGEISTLRAVLENNARAEVLAPVGTLQAEVRGNAVLEIHNTVESAQCDVRGQGALRIKQVTSSIKGTRGKDAKVDTSFNRSGKPASG
ncbi:MAG: J domain-containing protein [Deltaproteobacteria bacterium]|nr:J domain-containing protein [Deltaproteobacteria bacterium]